MAPPLLNLDDIRLTFGGPPLLDGVSLTASQGDRIALVGRNGSGKSTLLKIAAGLVEAQEGAVFLQPGTTVRYLEQAPDFSGHADIHAYVTAGLGPADDAYRADYLIEHLGLDVAASPATLSGGEARRAALARVLAPEPDILLLDEPTNHLDLATIEWLETELQRMKSAVIVISHDRRFLETVSRATVWLDRGQARRLDRGFAHFEAWRDKLLEEEERDAHKLGRRIVREEHWLRYGVTARRKRNMRRLSELNAMREAYRSRMRPTGTATLAASQANEAGKLVIEVKSAAKAYGGTTLVRDFSIRIQRGDRIGLVGPNGAGKTTLLKLLIGEIEPDEGAVRHGANLEIATLDQRRDSLDPAQSLADYLTGGRSDQVAVGEEKRHVVSYMKDFLFAPEQAGTPVRDLSGGERARLVLARILAKPSNVLVLDEPTNDLDMETLDLLQEMVSAYEGTVLLVSHDRDFLDRTVTAIIAPEGDGRWQQYAGGYSDMMAQRGQAPAERDRTRSKAGRPEKAEKQETSRQPKAPAKKLSYKQKYALETLPGRMEQLAAEIAALETALADPRLYETDPGRFNGTAGLLDEKRAALAAAEEEWLELEMLREELEA
ncbi:MAG: ATP-binding cassette domain-containing protein [Rhizobiaceae bacterium]